VFVRSFRASMMRDGLSSLGFLSQAFPIVSPLKSRTPCPCEDSRSQRSVSLLLRFLRVSLTLSRVAGHGIPRDLAYSLPRLSSCSDSTSDRLVRGISHFYSAALPSVYIIPSVVLGCSLKMRLYTCLISPSILAKVSIDGAATRPWMYRGSRCIFISWAFC